MADAQVTCVNKQPRDNPHEGITHLGGIFSSDHRWRLTRQEVIADIESGQNTYYTMVGGMRATVTVVHGPNGDYVRTRRDSELNNDLLALNECPVSKWRSWNDSSLPDGSMGL